MSEEIMLRHCSPTLAGLKTGNIITCGYKSASQMRDSVRRWNCILGKKGLRVVPLRYRDGRALIYIYRVSRLRRDLNDAGAKAILGRCGYLEKSPERCITRLAEKLGQDGEFPHEIGLFIGYPPEDVRGFMENRAGGCKCVGCWKVYGDAAAAEKTFAKYKKCTDVYLKQHKKGKSVEQLTVAG